MINDSKIDSTRLFFDFCFSANFSAKDDEKPGEAGLSLLVIAAGVTHAFSPNIESITE